MKTYKASMLYGKKLSTKSTEELKFAWAVWDAATAARPKPEIYDFGFETSYAAASAAGAEAFAAARAESRWIPAITEIKEVTES
jgi:hypothetical protein